ncbi:AAA family ATPase [Kitasatospora aureofaciens]|uniref:AAA family ATPase n=1 Tax=Kitasatospora aureofaciens TaxID=1894 RepID=UPI00382B48AB
MNTHPPVPASGPLDTLPPWLPYALGAGVLVLLAWLLVITGRYLMADKDTRRSIRQAARIRRTWPRLARSLGLVTIDRHPTLLASVANTDGKKPEPRTLVPALHTKADRYGVVVNVKTVPTVGLPEFQKAAERLAAAWQCTRVSVTPGKPGRLQLRAVRSEPLFEPYAYVPDGKPPADLTVWDLGIDEYAVATALRIADVPGMAVAGLPGYGKTSLINALISRLAPSDAVQFAVADGKVSGRHEGDYADVVDRLFAFVGDDLEEANALFTRLVKLRRARSSCIREVLGHLAGKRVKNMWDIGPSKEWPLVVLVIDEAHTYFRDFKGSDAATKRLAALAQENIRLVEDLVKKGRSVGILVILATQKATGDALPTAIRDVSPLRLSFAQTTTDASVAALGDNIRDFPDFDPTTLQDHGYKGVIVMARPGGKGFIRVRIPYVDPDDAARVAEDSAHLMADPFELLTLLTGPNLSKFTDLDDAA